MVRYLITEIRKVTYTAGDGRHRLGGGGASEKGHPLGRDRIGQRFTEEGQLGGWHGLGKGRKESRGIISGKTVAILSSEEHRKMGDGYEKARQINECGASAQAQPRPPVSASLRPVFLLRSLTQAALQGPKEKNC